MSGGRINAQVESVADIMKRFCMGATSYGSVMLEAHTALAEVCNRAFLMYRRRDAEKILIT